jgi:hypothetical protein
MFMSCGTLRILVSLTLALAPFANRAEAGVGDMSGVAPSLFERSSPVQRAQFSGDCWYDNGWNGPGYYQCGNEWNNGLGWIGPVAPIVGPAIRRRHPRGVAVVHPRTPNLVYPGAPSQRVGAAPSAGPRAGGSAFAGRRFRQFGAGGLHASYGVAAGGFHGGLGGGNFHQLHGAGVPHIGAPTSPGFVGGGFHGIGGAGNFHGAGGVPHVSAPAASGFTGGGGLHGLGGATGVHISAPASPGFANVGGFHAGGGIGAPHVGAASSPGFAVGGFHGIGGGGIFQGGGGSGQGGIGHR